MKFSTILFDLDDTIYPASSGLWQAIRQRIVQYLYERLGLPWEEIPALQQQFYSQYGTTLRGLQATRSVDTDDYLAYVHDIPMDQYLQPAPELRRMLLQLPYRRVIFTNANRDHARRVLQTMQLEDCFERVIDIMAVAPYCKPQPEAFQAALQLIGENQAARCIYLDDALRNLDTARQLGFYTIHVGEDGSQPADGHVSIPRLRNLPQVLPDSRELAGGD
ncbi:MAG: pyrimidine 5'-nucleotidase [Chloroflexi bacterium]|nr:pyrimidine 5'-nucleotidase [Chloroflexota bacterium]